ncbi:MAG: CHAT domain-containing protein [Pirellulales bacterium]|nr:CHAT domain-containing protein [Pirellulales bacterium]
MRAIALCCVLLLPWAAETAPAQDSQIFIRLEERLNALKADNRLPDAEAVGRQMLALARRDFAHQPQWTAVALADLAGVLLDMGRYPEAEPLCVEAVRIMRRAYGENDIRLATPLSNLANVYWYQHRFAEAEKMHRQVWRLRAQAYGPDDPRVADTIENVAHAISEAGKHADAEPLYKHVLKLRVQAFGGEHPDVVKSLYNLAVYYDDQGRAADALPLYQEALRITIKLSGEKDLMVSRIASRLGTLQLRSKRPDEAERYFRQAQSINISLLGPEHPWVLGDSSLARVYIQQGRFEDALSVLKQVLQFEEGYYGANSSNCAISHTDLGRLASRMEQPEQARQQFTRAIEICEQIGAPPRQLADLYMLRAGMAVQSSQAGDWQADLNRSLELAEQERENLAGGEQERAQAVAGIQDHYRLASMMFAAADQLDRAWEITEQYRSRTLVEQMLLSQVDLLSDVPPDQARQLRAAEQAAAQQVTELERQLAALPNQPTPAANPNEQRAALVQQLAAARQRLVAAYADIRTASPLYRQALRAGEKVSLDAMRQWLQDQQALLLYFTVDDSTGFLFTLDGSPQPPRRVPFELTAEQQAGLGVQGDLLSGAMLQKLFLDESNGLLRQITNPQKALTSADKLHWLWQTLIPEQQRADITSGKYKRLVVIPDGPLAMLPLELLVVEPGDQPKYLLDLEIPIIYGPSPTILYQLAHRGASTAAPAAEPILTVGDPDYSPASQRPAADPLPARYGGAGGALGRLPYSGREANWVAEVFKNNNIAAQMLLAAQATEGQVRAKLAGRRIVHLACHGLVDPVFGNFFGALALAPSPRAAADPRDDGFLTLNEICQLNLSACELAILSACETNYGPQQDGEGNWALTRGFLVAGSRRVVASNWLVDDESAASLISYYCGILARDEKQGAPVDYAAALAEAKRFIRAQPRWQHPYYWATFVLVGPG